MLPVPTVWASSNGAKRTRPMAAKTTTRAVKRRRELKCKITNLEFGIFTEPFLVHFTQALDRQSPFRWNPRGYQTCHQSSRPSATHPGFTGNWPLITDH